MATDTIEFEAPSGMALTVDVFPEGSDVAAFTGVAAAERANDKGTYRADLVGPTPGVHRVNLKDGAAVVGKTWVRLGNDGALHVAGDRDALIRLDAVGRAAADTERWKGATPNDLAAGRVDASVGAKGVLQDVGPQDVRDAMKLPPTAGAPAAGSVDQHLDDVQAGSDLVPTAIAAIGALNDLSPAESQAAADAALEARGYTAARAPNLDRLDVAVSSRAVAGDAMALTPAERTALSTALLDLADAIEAGLSLRGAIRLALAALAGEVSGAGTGTERFRNAVANSKERLVASVDAQGNRTAIAADAS